MSNVIEEMGLDLGELRDAIREEYHEVASDPTQGFHFHTGKPLAEILEYDDAWYAHVPDAATASFAGTGNPFSLGGLRPGMKVLDIGSGAGFDSLIAAKMVGPEGAVIGVDMTPAMLARARQALAATDLTNVEFKEGYGEALPVEDGWADVIISNGVLNLMPDKDAALREMARALKPNGHLQIADILVGREVPTSAKQNLDLWTG